MTVSSSAARRLCVAMLAPAVLLGAQGARAQNGQAPATVPGLDTYSLPAQPQRPTPLETPEPKIAPLPRPTPSATPTPVVTPAAPPTPRAVTPPPVRPTTRPTPAPTPTATPVARPTPVATPSPSAPVAAPAPTPTFAPQPTPTAEATPAPAPAPAPAATSGSDTLAYWAAGVGIVALLAGVVFYRRQRRRPRTDTDVEIAPPAAPIEPAPRPVAAAPEPVASPRARVEIDLEVKRAGTNLLSAAVEYRIILRNAGEADAHGIALDLRLFGVEPGLEPALEALFAAPLGQPVVARFDLAAGATAALEGTAMLPRGAMPPLALRDAGEGRALFVPVMTANLHYGWATGAGQTAASFVVGLDRGPDAKLGPFRLDGAPRMYDRVRQLPFTVMRAV